MGRLASRYVYWCAGTRSLALGCIVKDVPAGDGGGGSSSGAKPTRRRAQ